MGDIESLDLPWTYWITHFEPKTRHNVRKAQACSHVECYVWPCIQESKRWNCRYYYAHNNNLIERLKLVAIKDDLGKIKNVLSNTDVIEACTKKRARTKWNLFNLTIVTGFAAWLKEVPMGLKDAVIPEPHVIIHQVFKVFV